MFPVTFDKRYKVFDQLPFVYNQKANCWLVADNPGSEWL
jgi:hypothetical protein